MIEPLRKIVIDDAHGLQFLVPGFFLRRRLYVGILEIDVQLIFQQFLHGQREWQVLYLLDELNDSTALLARAVAMPQVLGGVNTE